MKSVSVINVVKKYNLFFIFCIVLFSFHLSYLIEQFNSICINKEFLTWDPNARMITSLQMALELKNFNILSYLWFILDSPTWPVLRNIFESLIFLFIEPSPYITIYISIFFFISTIFIFFAFSFYKIDISFKILFFSFIFSFLLASSPPILHYTFSGMLELQGGFFMLVSLFYFYHFLSNHNFLKNRNEKIIFIISVQALFHTKYPYGFMFCFSIIMYYIIFEFKLSCNIFFVLIRKSFCLSKKNLFLYISFIFIILNIIFYIFNIHKGKSTSYFRYIIFLFLLVHIFLHIFSNKNFFLRSIKGRKLYFLIKWTFLPIVLWIMMHPDRFSSSKGTISHFQVGSTPQSFINLDFFTIYFKELAFNISPISIFSIFLFILFLFSLVLKLKSRLSLIFSFIILIHLLGLTFLTPNHQARHIYHLFPSFLFSIFYFVISIEKKIILRFFSIIFIIQIFYFSLNYKTICHNSNLCFSGLNYQFYTVSRQVKNFIEKNINTDSILLNFFPKHHLNKTDIDFLMQLNSFKKNIVVLDSNQLEGKNVLMVSENCEIIEKSTINYKTNILNKIENKQLCLIYAYIN